jgi:hypothetical protein
MIRSISTLFMVLILVTAIYAQTAPEAPAGYRAELQRGTSYTGFQWTPGVSDFNGRLAAVVSTYDSGGDPVTMSLYGVHYGYFISTGWSIEGVLDFGTTSYESDVTNGTQKNDASQFGISAFAKYYFVPKFEDVSVWLGAGLLFGSVSTTVETPTATGTNKTETSGSSFGFGVDFGAQYFIGGGFSLTANYQFGFVSLSKPEYTVTSGSTSTTTKGAGGTIIGTRTGSLGLNFYF